MRRVLLDDHYEKMLSEHGFVVIPFLTDDELVRARALFDTLDPHLDRPFYSSIDSKSLDYRREADELLYNELGAKTEALFDRYSTIIYTFIVKLPNADTVINLHLDDVHVDQSLYRAVNFWIPLVDVDRHNGCLQVVPGSHKLPEYDRGFGLEYPYDAYNSVVTDYVKDVPMKAGYAVIYDDRLMHASYPNCSHEIRPAIISGLAPEEAEYIACFKHEGLEEGTVEYFSVNKDFWLSFDKTKRPENMESLGIKEQSRPQFSEVGFREILESVYVEDK